ILRVPTLLPFRDFPVIDRNFAPLWTLYTRETSSDATQQELLWGTMRYRRQNDGARYWSVFPLAQYESRPRQDTLEWNCLKGLFGYTRKAGRRSLRLLYFLSIPLDRHDAERLD
ncbi:MAG: hypothetical protein ABR497_11470, partial [Kiritimatiellia bacterium]|nr:hypothetical protein [Lentisphaerota bacterium]